MQPANMDCIYIISCTQFKYRYSTYSTNPLRYSPSGWYMFTGWSAGCVSWCSILTFRPAIAAAVNTIVRNNSLLTACEQLNVNNIPPGAIWEIARALSLV